MTIEELLRVTQDSVDLELEGEELKEHDILQEFGTLVSLNYVVPVHKTSGPLASADHNEDFGLGKRKPDTEAPHAKAKSNKKVKTSKNFLLEDSIEAGKLIDM